MAKGARKLKSVPTSSQSELRADDFANLFTGLGTSEDARTKSRPVGTILSYGEEELLWQCDALAARIIEKPSDDMVRAWFELNIENSDDAELVMAKLDELEAQRAFYDARCQERAHGGGAVYIKVDDGQAESEPLNEKGIRSIEYLTVLSMEELEGTNYVKDIGRGYGRPALWRLRNHYREGTAEVLIHESRLILFEGIQTSRKGIESRNGWGHSVLSRCYSAVRDFDTGYSGAAALMPAFLQDVWGIKDLARLASMPDGLEILKKRIKGVMISRSMLKSTVIDADNETFERTAVQVTGLPDLLDRFANRLAAAARMPVTLLMGQAPAGLNATGESDVRWYYDEISSEQEQRLRPKLNRLIKLLLLAKDGPTKGAEPENWTIAFRPLWQPTLKETIETRKIQSEIDVKYVDAGVLMPEEVAVSAYGGDDYSFERKLDLKARAAMAEIEETEEPEELEKEPEGVEGDGGKSDV